MKNFGKELILDLHECNSSKFTRYFIKQFFVELCELIDMEPCKVTFWDYQNAPEDYKKAPDHLKGTSAVQFISTSNITIHTLDKLNNVYLNIFSCKDFDTFKTTIFCKAYFDGMIVQQQVINRL